MSLLEELVDARRSKRAVVLLTRLDGGEQALSYPLEATSRPSDDWPIGAAERAVHEDAALITTTEAGEVFVRPYNPPVRLLIVGAVHVAQPLSRMAATVGIDVTVIDPRAAFATDDRFPGVTLVGEWPDAAVPALCPDHRTAIVALTHDPKLDDPALRAGLNTDAFYIGALGSRKTHAKRMDRLTRAGIEADALGRIRAPIGLDIGARTPSEIAVSILAELLAHRHGRGREP